MSSSANPLLDAALASLSASDRVRAVLARLHADALAETPFVSTDARPASAAETPGQALQRHTRGLFVALDPDKAAFVYLLLRGSGALRVVEAGTSFGVSTIWLALAVGQNAAAAAGGGGGGVGASVVATECEPAKAARARENWRSAGHDEVARWIDLREGDLLQTLQHGLADEIDFLLLDIWTPLALPTLELVRPRMKRGAMVVVDNIDAARAGYRDLLDYVAAPENGFRMTVLPYSGGLGLLVYTGPE